MKSARLAGAFILSLLLLSGAEARAQVGVIQGEVTDEQGNPLKDVQIRIIGMDVKREYKVKTNSKGKYYHAGVSLQGIYRVVAEKEGYQTDYVEGVRPSFGSDDPKGIINFVLKPGQSGPLAFELSDEERERLRKQAEEAEKKRQMAAKLREEFSAGLQAYNLNQFEQALEHFKKAAEMDAQQPAIWANMGNTYAKLKQYDEAVSAYQKAIELSPEEAAYYQNLGNIYAEMGQTEKAKEYYEKGASVAQAMDPKAAAIAYYNMGVTYINEGKNEEAAEALRKAIEADPQHAEAHYQMGLVLIGLNQIDEAIKYLKQYLKIAPRGENAEVAKALIEQLSGGN